MNKERENRLGDNDHRRGFWDTDKVAAMQAVAGEFNIDIQPIAEAGETVTFMAKKEQGGQKTGRTYPITRQVPEGQAYIQVNFPPRHLQPREGYGAFWRRADEVALQAKQASQGETR